MARSQWNWWSMRAAWTSLGIAATTAVALAAIAPASHLVAQAQPQNRPASSMGLVAVVDVNEVARQLGERERLQQQLADKQVELEERLTLLQQGYAKQYDERKAQLDQPPTTEQTQELEQLSISLNTQILQEKEAARSEYAQFQIELEENFTNRVRPHALLVAQSQGFSVVMLKQQAFAFAEPVDITPTLIAELKGLPEFTGGSPFIPTRRPRVGVSQPSGGQFNPNR